MPSEPQPAEQRSTVGRPQTWDLTSHESYALPTKPLWQTITNNIVEVGEDFDVRIPPATDLF